MKKLRLGGVPEHFNLPIHLAIEDGAFNAKGLEVEWIEYGGGTGQMTAALRNNEVDACILLTEGIIKDISAGNKSKVVSGYINTPLKWGVHTGSKNELEHHNQVYNKQYAISRFGSGSHLMAIVDASSHDKNISSDQFHIIKNLAGAIESLDTLETDVFYWEKYTTKPFVDNGQLRRIGEFVTPWPCFMIAATDEILEQSPDAIVDMLSVIHSSARLFMESDKSISLVSKRYEQNLGDVERWFHATEWATHGWVSDKMLKSVVYNLRVAGLIDDEEVPDLVWRRK
jgi:sulfonate transport system substrate-binding protein